MKFKPMLAAQLPANYELQLLAWPLLCSAKLDGVRACVQSGVLVSRNLKPIPNAHTQHLFGRVDLEGLDGELVVGKPTDSDEVFRRTSSAVMSRQGKPEVFFRVFDYFDPAAAFMRRLEVVKRKLRHASIRMPHYRLGNSSVVHCALQIVQQRQIISAAELLEEERRLLTQGYEGCMLRDPFGLYKQGRSTLREFGLVKLKRFADGEAVVLGVAELMSNQNQAEQDALGRAKRSSHKAGLRAAGVLGALLVRDCKTGAEFSIGSGFTQEERIAHWNNKQGKRLIDSIVKYKYFATGGKERPRFPVFCGFRSRRDM